eukprot:GSChrysophyteH1.ASY1.ANO1.2549.1 assembled CDS
MQRASLFASVVLLALLVPTVSVECSGVCDVTSCDFLDDMCLNKIDQFSGNFSLPEMPCEGRGIGLFFEVLLFLYAMLGLAIVCDDYMCVSLERLCDVWMIREDVAGATFMAFGSAAPEIIINMVSALDATNMGVGAILGSGMIAFLIIPSACALATDDSIELKLKRRPLLRDITSYTILLFMLYFFLRDGTITFSESLSLVLFYCCYVLVVIMSPKIRRTKSFVIKKNSSKNNNQKEESMFEAVCTEDDDSTTTVSSSSLYFQETTNQKSRQMKRRRAHHLPPMWSEMLVKQQMLQGKGKLAQFLQAISRPLVFLLDLTCPCCEEGAEYEHYYPLTFIMSFLWVSLFSTIIGSCVQRWTYFTPAWAKGGFFGLLTIAIGAEIPDTIQSVTMAKRGYGSMAVSNAIGSQIINIALGLGASWLIANIVQMDSDAKFQVTDHKDLAIAASFQFAAVLVNFICLLGMAVYFGANKAILTKLKGKLMIGVYVCIIICYIGVMLHEHSGPDPCAGSDDNGSPGG